jgi:MFS family permease
VSAAVTWIGLFSAAFATQIWHILLTQVSPYRSRGSSDRQGIIVGAGQGLAIPLFMSLPSQWFDRHRGLASGIAIGGAGLGGGFSTLMVRPMLSALGTKYTLM